MLHLPDMTTRNREYKSYYVSMIVKYFSRSYKSVTYACSLLLSNMYQLTCYCEIHFLIRIFPQDHLAYLKIVMYRLIEKLLLIYVMLNSDAHVLPIYFYMYLCKKHFSLCWSRCHLLNRFCNRERCLPLLMLMVPENIK